MRPRAPRRRRLSPESGARGVPRRAHRAARRRPRRQRGAGRRASRRRAARSRDVSIRRTPRRPSQLLAIRLLYQGLVAFGERGDIEPALATAWTVSRDGLVWTFRLRQDVQLHDGTPLGPDEVVATLAERISDDEPPDGAPAWVRPFRGAARIVREVRRGEGDVDPDRRRAAVRAAPRAPGSPGLAIAVARSGGPRVGSGPYRSVELTPDRLALEAATSGEASRP